MAVEEMAVNKPRRTRITMIGKSHHFLLWIKKYPKSFHKGMFASSCAIDFRSVDGFGSWPNEGVGTLGAVLDWATSLG